MASPRTIVIVSGGQSGVDRAALDIAIELGLEHRGWCPAGRRAEDGPIAMRYQLVETASAEPAERTRLNVRDSDATLIIAPQPIAGGTALARDVAIDLGRPLLIVDPSDPEGPSTARAWLEELASADAASVINVAGPRESEHPGIAAQAARLLRATLARTRRRP